MTAESASNRQQQWALVVRRSFGISDRVADEEAREALIGSLEDQLRENGWQSPTRGIAEPMVDALMALGANGHLRRPPAPRWNAAYRLLARERRLLTRSTLSLTYSVNTPLRSSR